MKFLSRFKTQEQFSEDYVTKWKQMYEGTKNSPTLNLPAAISAELARLVTIEMEVKLSGGAAAKTSEEAINSLAKNLRSHTELCCALGGGMFRPFFDGKKLRIEFFPADKFEVTSFSAEGVPDGCIFFDTFKDGRFYYTRKEEHRFTQNGYTITNCAYRGHTKGDCTIKVPLATIPRWEHLAEETVISNLSVPLFVYFRMPGIDNKNPDRKLGASVFSRAESLIKEADAQLERLIWEFEGGELAVDASIDALRFGEKGTYKLPKHSQRLFRGLGIDAGDHDLYSVFSPALRDSSIINGLNELLMRIEDACSLARGTFSNLPDVARTATEIKILNQRSYATVCDIQSALKTALEGICTVLHNLEKLYGLPSGGSINLSVEFDDSIVTDRATEFEEKLKLVEAEIMTKDEFKKWYFG